MASKFVEQLCSNRHQLYPKILSLCIIRFYTSVRMWGTWHIRAYAPSIAQGEGMSLGEWRTRGIFSLSPHIHKKRQNTSYDIKLLHINYVLTVNISSLAAIFWRFMLLFCCFLMAFMFSTYVRLVCPGCCLTV